MSAAASAALGVVQAVQGIAGQSSAKKKADKAFKLSQSAAADQKGLVDDYLKPLLALQSGQYNSLAPGLGGLSLDAIKRAKEYDPAVETDAALRQFDSAANESLNRDLTTARLPLQLRGLEGSSEDGSASSGVLARRSIARGKFASELRMGEKDRKLANTGATLGIGSPIMQSFNPAATAQGAAGILGGSAQTNSNLSAQLNSNAAAVNPFASLQGVNWDWLKIKGKPKGYQYT